MEKVRSSQAAILVLNLVKQFFPEIIVKSENEPLNLLKISSAEIKTILFNFKQIIIYIVCWGRTFG